MASQIIKDQSVYLDGYDLTGRSNALALDYSAELQDATTLGQASRVKLPGLKSITAQVSGFMDIDATDLFLFSNMGVKDKPFSFGAAGDAVGDAAYTFLAAEADIKIGANIGDMFKFDAGGESTDRLIRGKLMLNSKAAALTATGNGTANQLGAVSATQRIYVAMHVLNAGTGAVTVKLQSDSANTFGGAETDRITMTAATGIGSEMKSVAGAITDTWWRIRYTISGGAPSFKLVIVVGIL